MDRWGRAGAIAVSEIAIADRVAMLPDSLAILEIEADDPFSLVGFLFSIQGVNAILHDGDPGVAGAQIAPPDHRQTLVRPALRKRRSLPASITPRPPPARPILRLEVHRGRGAD